MSLWPLGVWLLAGFALLNEPLLHVDTANPVPWRWLWLVAAVGVFAWETRGRARRPHSFRSVRFAVLLACAFLVGDTVAALGLASLAAAELTRTSARLSRATAALALTGKGLATAALAALALAPILARVHELPGLNDLAAGVLRLLGGAADAGERSLTIAGSRARPELALTVEKLGLGPALVLLLIAACALAQFRKGWAAHCWVLLVAAWAAYLVARVSVLLAIAADSGEYKAFIEPFPVLIGFLPGAVLAGLLLAPRLEPGEELDTGELSDAGFLPLVATIACLVLALGSWDPGTRKEGRILVDEGHSDWEPTDAALDRSTFGELSTYNYASLFDFLGRHYPSVERNEAPLTPRLLEACDVLVLKTPTQPYGADELDALVDFVERGGGLWLIGDHTNVFGTAMYLNPIASRFGIRFRADAVNDVGSEGLQLYSPPAVRRHPITVHMPDLLMATSCSLDVGPGVSCAMVGNTLWADAAGYDAYNFFGDHEMDGTESWGQFVQSATVEHGAGRVAAYTDSTTLSSFSFFLPGNWELCLGTVEWLDHRRGSGAFFLWRAGASVGALLACLWLTRASTSPLRTFSVEALACGVFLGFVVVDAHTAATQRLPDARAELPLVAFEREHCAGKLPLTHEAHEWDDDNYLTFFVWTQRVGRIPRVTRGLSESLELPACILIEPTLEFSEAELDRIDEYLQGGGRVLVLDDPVGEADSVGPLLARHGLSFGERQRFPGVVAPGGPTEGDPASVRVSTAWSVEGGTPCLHSSDGVVLAAYADVGRGRIVACGISRPFAQNSLGMPIHVPSRAQRVLEILEFALLDTLLAQPAP